MRWLLSLTLGLLIAWIIVLYVNKMRRTSYFYKADSIQPAPLAELDASLVAVGLAQYPQVPSIMDSVNRPTPAPPGRERPEKPTKLPQRGPPPSQGPAPMTPTSTPMSPVPTNSPSFSPTPIPSATPKPSTTTPVGANLSGGGGALLETVPSGTRPSGVPIRPIASVPVASGNPTPSGTPVNSGTSQLYAQESESYYTVSPYTSW